MVPSVFGQSVADAARKNRPKDAKITSKRVWTDDDVKHADPNQHESTPQTKALPKTTQPGIPTDNVVIEAKTPEQVGWDCFGERRFLPTAFDADSWQQNLWTLYSASAGAVRDWNSNHTAAALANMATAQSAYTEARGRCRAAVHAAREWDSWRAAHLGEF
jgi:hypothetical protein